MCISVSVAGSVGICGPSIPAKRGGALFRGRLIGMRHGNAQECGLNEPAAPLALAMRSGTCANQQVVRRTLGARLYRHAQLLGAHRICGYDHISDGNLVWLQARVEVESRRLRVLGIHCAGSTARRPKNQSGDGLASASACASTRARACVMYVGSCARCRHGASKKRHAFLFCLCCDRARGLSVACTARGPHGRSRARESD